MESEILHTLKEIRGILYVMVCVFSVGVLFWILRSISIIANQFKGAWSEDWKARANDYFDKGDFDELIKHCETRKEKYPNDANVYWWMARSYMEKGELEKARELFEKVLKIEPGWEKEYVTPYIPDE